MKKYNSTGILYAIIGGILSFIALSFLENITGLDGVEGSILRGVLVLSMVICFCTGKILDSLDNK